VTEAPDSDERHSRRIGSDERAARAAGRSGGRLLLVLSLALAGGAAALEGAARLAWFTAGVEAVGRGTVDVTATGADLLPALSGVALLALAAVAAAVAVAGLPRRVLGVLVAAAGGYVGVMVVRLLVSPPSPADLADLPGAPAGGTTVAGSVASHPGPLLAALGAVLLITAGAALVVADRRLPRLGARYSARPEQAATDPDRATWEALDAGVDPTLEAGDSGAGRSDGGASGGNV
jgi:uncharacterized membrane protein (TIGR02234 family)